jgi:uncharacterized membrane protein YozB (DUF420 family)
MKEKRNVDFYVNHKKDSEGRQPNDMSWLFRNPYLYMISIFLSVTIVPIGVIMTILYYKNNQKTLAIIIGAISSLWIVLFSTAFLIYLFQELNA